MSKHADDFTCLLGAARSALLGLESALRTAKASVAANDQYAAAAATQVNAYERKIKRLREAIRKAEGGA